MWILKNYLLIYDTFNIGVQWTIDVKLPDLRGRSPDIGYFDHLPVYNIKLHKMDLRFTRPNHNIWHFWIFCLYTKFSKNLCRSEWGFAGRLSDQQYFMKSNIPQGCMKSSKFSFLDVAFHLSSLKWLLLFTVVNECTSLNCYPPQHCCRGYGKITWRTSML